MLHVVSLQEAFDSMIGQAYNLDTHLQDNMDNATTKLAALEPISLGGPFFPVPRGREEWLAVTFSEASPAAIIIHFADERVLFEKSCGLLRADWRALPLFA